MSICYEDAFGAELIGVLDRATLLANVSNDAWFGGSVAPHQHLQIGRMRALGARRVDLVFVRMAESVALALAGAVLGVAIAHVAAASIGAWLPAAALLAAAAWRFSGSEGLVVALAVGAGTLAACWPAWRASRLDVAATLSDS